MVNVRSDAVSRLYAARAKRVGNPAALDRELSSVNATSQKSSRPCHVRRATQAGRD